MTDTLGESTGPHAASLNGAVEFITIPEWCRRMGCSLDSGYRAVRRDQVPGLFRIGRLIRINWPAFVAATTPVPVAKDLGRESHRRGAARGGP
jgi:predicted DNA-binding transcriptional regulator AlpA